MQLHQYLTIPEPLQDLHVSGFDPGGTPVPSAKERDQRMSTGQYKIQAYFMKGYVSYHKHHRVHQFENSLLWCNLGLLP